MNEEKLIHTISEAADMGSEALGQVIDKVSDLQMKEMLSAQREEYKRVYEEADRLAQNRNLSAKKINPVAKVQSGIIADVKSAFTGNVTSKVAEMVIQGSTMGVTKVSAGLHSYSGDDGELRRLAERHIKTEQANIDQMKQYL